jgi:FtsP/CotA-like multicopper oxidase with cupredoxin domain
LPSDVVPTGLRAHLRLAIACVAALAIVGTLGWMWMASRLPSSYSAMSMGTVDTGGAPAVGLAAHGHGSAQAGSSAGSARDVTTLVEEQTGRPDVTLTLTARREKLTLGPGLAPTAYTLNGTTPGPTLHARQGDLVEVRFVNESVPDGATLHWHGIDVPNAADGVAGVTQDAVAMGESHTYRFVARDAGTYWYHSHQVSHEQVLKGLLGGVVIAPANDAARADHDVVALSHVYSGRKTINGKLGDSRVVAAPGETVRVRVINSDNGLVPVWVSGAAYRLLAVDGTDVVDPAEVTGRSVLVPAGGRADLGVVVPRDGSAVRVEFPGAALVVGPEGSSGTATRAPADRVDLLTYGKPAPLGFDPEDADRRFEYSIGRRPGFVAGKPGMHWSINGKLYPNIPMFVVAEGDTVRVRIENNSSESHPMHLHGHHVLVLSRDGVEATGSPWWTDSLEVGAGESYDVAFVADNPGIWSDHCHNLPHAKEGLIAHLMYEGVTTPFRLGKDTGNSPD